MTVKECPLILGTVSIKICGLSVNMPRAFLVRKTRSHQSAPKPREEEAAAKAETVAPAVPQVSPAVVPHVAPEVPQEASIVPSSPAAEVVEPECEDILNVRYREDRSLPPVSPRPTSLSNSSLVSSPPSPTVSPPPSPTSK